MLLSSTHIENSVTTDECKKPLRILDYSQKKGGVNMFDENLEKFSCRRKTAGWPMLFFLNMIDVADNNAYILMKKCGRYSKSKKCFLKNLSFQLAKSAVENRDVEAEAEAVESVNFSWKRKHFDERGWKWKRTQKRNC